MTGSGVLKVVLFADLVGYSRLMAADESGTMTMVSRCFEVARRLCREHVGDFVKTTGDGFVVLFDAAGPAAEFAVKMHRATSNEKELGSKCRLRIGIHVGEVHRDKTDVYGHAMNIASRLEGAAAPGSTLVSSDFYHFARRNTHYRFESAGIPVLKNVQERIAVFKLLDVSSSANALEDQAVELSVIDGLSARVGDKPIKLPDRGTVPDLLAVLALHDRHAETQSKLAALIWPNHCKRAAKQSLSRSKRNAQRLFENVSVSALQSDSEMVWFDSRLVSVDLDRMLDQLRLGHVDDILLHGIDWNNQLVPSLNRGGVLLSAWSSVKRDNWNRTFSDTLEDCLDRFDPVEEGCRRAAIALLGLQPGHEPACRALMKHLIARGNRAGAITQYKTLVEYLEENFGLAPDPETSALAQSLSTTPEYPASVVLENTSSIQQQRRLRIGITNFAEKEDAPARAHGFRADLIANLSRFREWSIGECGENSPSTERGESGFDYSLDGSIGDNGAETHLTLWLSEVKSNRVVWSDSFDIHSNNWRQMQREAIGRIAAALEVYVSADRLAVLLGKQDSNTVSFDQWLRGEQLLSRWKLEADAEAEKIFEGIIERDPTFAPALASLVSIHNVRHIVSPGRPRDPELDRKALELGQRAIELDPMDARAHLAVAWAAALNDEFDQAQIHLDMAITLNPNSAKTLISAAMGYSFFGDATYGVELLDRAKAITPMLTGYQWCYAAAIHYLAGDYDSALKATARSGDAIIDNQGWRAAAFSRLGRHNEAKKALSRLIERVRPLWAGKTPATDESIKGWFNRAYPLRFETLLPTESELL